MPTGAGGATPKGMTDCGVITTVGETASSPDDIAAVALGAEASGVVVTAFPQPKHNATISHTPTASVFPKGVYVERSAFMRSLCQIECACAVYWVGDRQPALFVTPTSSPELSLIRSMSRSSAFHGWLQTPQVSALPIAPIQQFYGVGVAVAFTREVTSETCASTPLCSLSVMARTMYVYLTPAANPLLSLYS